MRTHDSGSNLESRKDSRGYGILSRMDRLGQRVQGRDNRNSHPMRVGIDISSKAAATANYDTHRPRIE